MHVTTKFYASKVDDKHMQLHHFSEYKSLASDIEGKDFTLMTIRSGVTEDSDLIINK